MRAEQIDVDAKKTGGVGEGKPASRPSGALAIPTEKGRPILITGHVIAKMVAKVLQAGGLRPPVEKAGV